MLNLSLKNCIFSFDQEMAETDFLSAIERTTVGIYVARDTTSSEPSDVRIVLEGVMVLQDLENVALASAMLFGLFYALNMQYPTKLRYTFEVFQNIIMELDADELSRKAQSLNTKLCQWRELSLLFQYEWRRWYIVDSTFQDWVVLWFCYNQSSVL